MLNSRNSIMGSADKANSKDTSRLKKQNSYSSKNNDTSSLDSSRKDSSAQSVAKDKEGNDDKNNQTAEDKFKKFEGEGVVFKTKLIGSELVMEPRGDKMCQNSIQRLKAIIKGQKAHKKRIVMKISYDGVKIYDEKTNELLYHHEVPQISFISSDDTDSRTFGYVCDVPNKAHQFICFKTTGPALQVMSVISSLFEAVLEKKKKQEAQQADGAAGSELCNDNNNSNDSKNNNNNKENNNKITSQQQSDSILDDQLIIQDNTSIGQQQESVAANQTGSSPKRIKESATEELTKQLGHTLSFSSPMDLFDGGSDSGIIESPSTTFNEWSIPPPPVPAHTFQNQPTQQQQQLHNQQQYQQQYQQQQQQQQHQHQKHQRPSVTSMPMGRPNWLNSLNSSSPITISTARMGAPAAPPMMASSHVIPGALSQQNRSLIYNHSSVSLNDDAITSRSPFLSPIGTTPQQHHQQQQHQFQHQHQHQQQQQQYQNQQHQHQLPRQHSQPAPQLSYQESTDRYAVFNDIENLPSIFESTSSLGSKTNLSNVGNQTAAAAASAAAVAATNNMASRSAAGLSRQTNPFDDDFFS